MRSSRNDFCKYNAVMKKTLLGCGGLIVVAAIIIGIVAAVAGSGGGSGHPVKAAATPAQPVSTEPASPPPPSLTQAQKQIITSAAGYLTDGQGFSERGLFDQLTSASGEGFPRHLARWVLRRIDASGAVSWNHQAVLAAKGYLQSGQGFSCSGLIDQLSSPYGDQFTRAQAAHAARVTGAC